METQLPGFDNYAQTCVSFIMKNVFDIRVRPCVVAPGRDSALASIQQQAKSSSQLQMGFQYITDKYSFLNVLYRSVNTLAICPLQSFSLVYKTGWIYSLSPMAVS